jgi:sulfate adenylyltransferase
VSLRTEVAEAQGDASPADALVPPHGGRLVDRILRGEAAREAAVRARGARAVPLGPRAAADLDLLATGAYSPLEGFMGRQAYRSVVEAMRLPDGPGGDVLWPLPVVLPVEPEVARAVRDGERVALEVPGWGPVGTLRVEDRFQRDPAWEARHVFGTDDPRHPGVRRCLEESPWCLGGPVEVFARPPAPFPRYRLDPSEARRRFAARGWRTVAGFQTRNPVHRAHEYLQKCALEVCDGLLLHPLVGETKEDDVPAAVRLASYEALLRHYYPPERVCLAAFPAAMRYAGPREAVFHAICRKNYGCSHFIVGRDHAGVGSYYPPAAAQELVLRLAPELGVTPLCFANAFYCRRCAGMATERTCPHGPEVRVALSGTAVRAMLRRGEAPPPEFTRPEVAEVLIRWAAGER